MGKEERMIYLLSLSTSIWKGWDSEWGVCSHSSVAYLLSSKEKGEMSVKTQSGFHGIRFGWIIVSWGRVVVRDSRGGGCLALFLPNVSKCLQMVVQNCSAFCLSISLLSSGESEGEGLSRYCPVPRKRLMRRICLSQSVELRKSSHPTIQMESQRASLSKETVQSPHLQVSQSL